MNRTYRIQANESALDVIANNDITLESDLTLEEAQIASLEYQRQGHHIAVWIEEEATKPAPRIVRTVEQDRTGVRYSVTRLYGWAI
jgi:hypothetical protein